MSERRSGGTAGASEVAADRAIAGADSPIGNVQRSLAINIAEGLLFLGKRDSPATLRSRASRRLAARPIHSGVTSDSTALNGATLPPGSAISGSYPVPPSGNPVFASP